MPQTYQVDLSHRRPKGGNIHIVHSTAELKYIEPNVAPNDIIKLHAGNYGWMDSWESSGLEGRPIWFEPVGDGLVHFDFASDKTIDLKGNWLHFDGGPKYQMRITNRKNHAIRTNGDHITLAHIDLEGVGIHKDDPKHDPTAILARSPNFEFIHLRFNNCFGNAIYVANDSYSPIMKNGSVFFCEFDFIHGSGVQFNPHLSDQGNYLDGFYRIGGNYFNQVGHQLTKQGIVITPQDGTNQMRGRVVASGNLIEECYEGIKAVHNQGCEAEFRKNIVRYCKIGLFQSRADNPGTKSVTWIDNDSYMNDINIQSHPKANVNDMFADNRNDAILEWNQGLLTDMDWTKRLGITATEQPEEPIDPPPPPEEDKEIQALRAENLKLKERLAQIHELSRSDSSL